MALSMVIVKPNLPSVIKAQPNGSVDPSLLAIVDKPGLIWEMAELPARGMRALHAAASAEGIDLRSTGRGRTLAQQWQIFGGSQARYQPVGLGDYSAAPSANRKLWPLADYTSAGQGLPAPGRKSAAALLGVTIPDTNYWIKIEVSPGHYPATAAVPGTSNHGFWCADDLQEYVGGIGLPSIRPSTLQWLYGNAQRFGFAWELATETWHIHWVSGDKVPQAVLDYENGAPVPPTPVPPTPEPPVNSELMITIYELTDAQAVFIAYTFHGVALQVEWSGDGTDPAVQDRIRLLKQFGATVTSVTVADIGRTTLLGDLPKGDALHNWQSSDFAKHIPAA